MNSRWGSPLAATSRGVVPAAGRPISSRPAGLAVNVSTTGRASLTIGTSVTLTVNNGRSAIWSGACSSGGNKVNTCTFTIAGAASVSANVQ